MVAENRNTSILDVAMPVAQSLLLPFVLPSYFGHRQSFFCLRCFCSKQFAFLLLFLLLLHTPPSLLFAPFLFINYKSQLPLGFFLFLLVLFCFSFLGLSFRLGDCGRACLEDVVLVHFFVVLHSLSFL